MPEIAEVARTVHFIRKLLVGKTIGKVTAAEDANVYGKVGTSAAEFQKHMTGKKIVDAGQQGKYFWIIMSSPPHPVMHFGMSGWLKFRSEHTYYYKPKKGEEKEEWPPRFCKFILETKESKGEEKIEAAFVDMRRFARIRLVDCPAAEIRNVTPLKENGPDPVIDSDIVSVEWLMEKCRAKKVPIKAMLLDQANISGIGNWVGDEIMYNARMHPEQYANTLMDTQIKQLHKSIHYICGTAVDLLADSEKFPEDWLFKHRWGKGKKDGAKTLPSGEKITFLTVGGRTSAVVPSLQKKTGPVAGEVSDAKTTDEDVKPKKTKGAKRKVEEVEEEEEPQKVNGTSKGAGKKKSKTNDDATPAAKLKGAVKTKSDTKAKLNAKSGKESKVKEESEEVESSPPPPKAAKKGNKQGKATQNGARKRSAKAEVSTGATKKADDSFEKINGIASESGRRRSGRLGKS